MTRLMALYPRTWRDRYEDEFLALLADRPPDPLDRVDIVRGALDARLHPAPAEPTPVGDGGAGSSRNRRLGWLMLLGVPIWFAAVVIALNGPIVTDSWGTYRDGMAAHPLAFIAICLLLVGMAAAAAALPSGSWARTGTLIGGLAGLLWAFAPWFFPATVVLCIGLVILGIASWRAGRWRGVDAALLVGGMILAWGWLFVTPLRLVDDYVGFFAFFATTWLAVGHALLRPAHRASRASGRVRAT